MALTITEDCINCNACLPECPNEAISEGPLVYLVDADKCTECVGHYETSQCKEVCPVDCILPDPARIEDRAQLLVKYQQLAA